jgi:2-phosphoglycerate kinase
VQSLVAAGLSFQEAYAAAQDIRNDLSDQEEIARTELRARVAEYLQRRFDPAIRRSYETEVQKIQEILVHTPDRTAPFSVGLLSHYLEGCALRHDEALDGARTVHEYLLQQGDPEIDSRALRRVVYDTLRSRGRLRAANRFLSRCRFEDSGQPLLILVGGAPGAGKSTVTARLAFILDIVRTQSTDMMREIIRCYLAPHVVPTLAFSSFEAWRGLPEIESAVGGPTEVNPVVAGFLSQFGTVKVALEATIGRALKERDDLIVDGVHVLPDKLDLDAARKQAVVVPLVLAVTNAALLHHRLRRRGREQPERGSSRSTGHLDAIWNLQSYILDGAERSGIPIIANWGVEDTVQLILEEVMTLMAERFPPDPEAICGVR